MNESKFINDFKSALRVSVPLVVAQTADPAAVMNQVVELTAIKDTENYNSPIIRWDVASGLKGLNKTGIAALNELLATLDPKPQAEKVTDPSGTLKLMKNLPQKSILFILNGHRFIGERGLQEAIVGQAIWNLRDEFKKNSRILVILSPSTTLPEELKQDILVLDDPLPTTSDLSKLLLSLYEAAHSQNPAFPEKPEEATADKAVDAVRGLSMFAAEQAIAMSLQKDGVNLEKLWHRKKKQVENTPGLTIYSGTETFADVRGVENAKDYLTQLFQGEEAPTEIVFLDEIEKMFAGIQGDMSGVSQDQHGEFLRWTQDNKVLGMIFVGHPGCSKSFLAKACAGQFKVPMVELNISALKAGIIGQTGSQTRAAFKTISAIGRPLIIATSNSLGILPPELKRRFKQGTWFFDLPNKEERKAVWDLYIKRYNLVDNKIPPDKDWTPDEIETCCKTAWRLKCTLVKASKYVVPISVSDPQKILDLKKQADGKFLNASHEGTYEFTDFQIDIPVLRKIGTGDYGEA